MEEEAHQSLIAGHELADARMLSGELSACDDLLAAQVEVAKHRRELEVARTHDRLAWLDWSDGHASRTNELLAEIRDLLTKMANPPIMVSLESTPESRAAPGYVMIPILNTPYRSWSVMKDGFQWGVARITTGGALEIRIDSTQFEAFIQQLERAP